MFLNITWSVSIMSLICMFSGIGRPIIGIVDRQSRWGKIMRPQPYNRELKHFIPSSNLSEFTSSCLQWYFGHHVVGMFGYFSLGHSSFRKKKTPCSNKFICFWSFIYIYIYTGWSCRKSAISGNLFLEFSFVNLYYSYYQLV